MTVADILISHRDALTPTERQLLNTLLDDYPIAGLGSITELANAACVSTTTVARMLQKTGMGGYPQFQAALRRELKEMISDPIAKRDLWDNDLPDEHILNRYSRQSLENQKRSIDDLNTEDFDTVCALIGDPDRAVYLAGGRVTGTLAQYLFLHLQMIRPNVHQVARGGSWPHDFLDLKAGDIVILFDVRRYENTTLQMAQMCHEKGAEIILFTDHWRSPIHRIARHTFTGRIAVPSAWDTALPLLMLTECMIAAVQQNLWEDVRARTDALEEAFDRTKLFRKFV